MTAYIPGPGNPEHGRVVFVTLWGEHYTHPVTVAEPLSVTDWPRDSWVAVCPRRGEVRLRERREAIRLSRDADCCAVGAA